MRRFVRWGACALLALGAWSVPTVGFGQGNGPKTYCVLDLSAGAGAAKFPVTYLDAEPAGGFNTTEYKTTKLVLKRVEPGSFVMGANQTDEAHRVTLSRPFYLGLFEVTQKQWECVMGSVPDFYLSPTADPQMLGDALPVAYVSHTDIRGDARDASYETNVGTNDTFLVRLRAKTGLAFDLPTEAQWERACRAGTTTAFSHGDEPDGAYMWSYDNSYYEDGKRYDVHEVGTKKPNPWGFYDMHGNAQEWCRDVYVRDALYPYGEDPFVTALMDNTDWRAIRGGGYIFSGTQNTSAYRARWRYKDDGTGIGFRLGLDVGGIATTYGPLVPGEPVSIALPDLVGYAAKGLPAGLKFNAKTGAITGAATRPTAAGGVTVTFTKRGEETLTTRFVVGPFPVLSVSAPDAPATCKVTGAGAYAAGRKVTLRATAAKGFVFAGWYADADFETPLAGDVDFRTPSYPYVMPTEDVALFARFVPADEDAAALLLPPVAPEYAPGDAVELALDVRGCVSLPTVKVTGLPPGLKFTAKALDVRATKTAPAAHYAANTIYGAPTKSGVYAANVTVTTAGKKTATETILFAVVDRAKDEYILKIASDATKGKVTGAGVYAAGRKVALKATPAKGYVFAGWYKADGSMLQGDGGVDGRTPSITYVMKEADAQAVAQFRSAADPLASQIDLVAGGVTVLEEVTEHATFQTDGVLALPLFVSSDSLPKMTVAGLPPGLRFTAKRLLNHDGTVLAEANTVYGTATKPGTYVVTVKITNAAVKKAVERRFAIVVDNLTGANELLRVTDAASGRPASLKNGRGEKYTVYAGVEKHELPAITVNDSADKLTLAGLPAGLKYDAKQGAITGVPTKAGFYTVTATVRSGRESSVSTFTVEVVAMPEWAVGTYVGFGICELERYTPLTNNIHWTFTVAANGKVSGKVVFDTGEDRLLTATFSKPSLAAYNKWTECYGCDVRILLKDGRDVVVDQVRRLGIAPNGVEGLYEKRIGVAWMDRVNEETGVSYWDGSILNAFQNAWKRKGFEGLPQFAEKKTTVSVTDAALLPDPSEPEVDPGTADLTLDIAQNGTVTATLALKNGGKVKKLVTKGDLIVYTADVSESGTLVYSAYVSLVFGNLRLLYADVELEESADGKIRAEGCRIVSVDRFAAEEAEEEPEAGE